MIQAKRKIALFLTVIYVFLLSITTTSANGAICVLINEIPVVFDVQPQIIDGRTMVPMRKIFESLGAVVTWDAATQSVTGKKDDIIINMSIDSKVMFKNGVPRNLDVPPTLIDSRTLVPVRAIAESFNCDVQWIAETQTVKITTSPTTLIVKPTLSATEISEKVSPSVFYIEVYDSQSNPVSSGSGFFVTKDGVAVTNYHVIEGSSQAWIQTKTGDIYEVTGVLSFDKSLDVAIIKINKTSAAGNTVTAFPAVTMGDSDNIKSGQTIYAIGSPKGMQDTISNGIIGNVNQIVNDYSFIQITAPISHGSSGGALIDEYGEIIGITSAGIESGENIGFAIPINVIKRFDLNMTPTPYDEFFTNTNQFILEIYPTNVELEIGETVEVYVRAEGKNNEDWSIYWDETYGNIVSCEWGDWFDDYPSVCSLKITGKASGTEVVTVYSDVDFVGKDIVVNVKKPSIETYLSSSVTLPTFDSVTGCRLIDVYDQDSAYSYIYNCTSSDLVSQYITYLIAIGFTHYEHSISEIDSTIVSFDLITPDGRHLIRIASAIRKYGEVWIHVPK